MGGIESMGSDALLDCVAVVELFVDWTVLIVINYLVAGLERV